MATCGAQILPASIHEIGQHAHSRSRTFGGDFRRGESPGDGGGIFREQTRGRMRRIGRHPSYPAPGWLSFVGGMSGGHLYSASDGSKISSFDVRKGPTAAQAGGRTGPCFHGTGVALSSGTCDSRTLLPETRRRQEPAITGGDIRATLLPLVIA